MFVEVLSAQTDAQFIQCSGVSDSFVKHFSIYESILCAVAPVV